MIDTLQSLLEEQIKDLYSAENQLLKALPEMAKTARSESLREAFTNHLEETRRHVERLQEMAQTLEIAPGGKKCKGMEGLLAEGKEMMDEDGEDASLDAGLIAAAQRVEHYEISAYGSARALAERLEEETLVELLQATLDEEEAADKTLTGVSEEEILPSATTTQSENSEGPADGPKSKKKTSHGSGSRR